MGMTNLSEFVLRPTRLRYWGLVGVLALLWISAAVLISTRPIRAEQLPIPIVVVTMFSLFGLVILNQRCIKLSAGQVVFYGLVGQRAYQIETLRELRLYKDRRRRGAFPCWVIEFSDGRIELIHKELFSEASLRAFVDQLKRCSSIAVALEIMVG